MATHGALAGAYAWDSRPGPVNPVKISNSPNIYFFSLPFPIYCGESRTLPACPPPPPPISLPSRRRPSQATPQTLLPPSPPLTATSTSSRRRRPTSPLDAVRCWAPPTVDPPSVRERSGRPAPANGVRGLLHPPPPPPLLTRAPRRGG